jgi:hypothetical protein
MSARFLRGGADLGERRAIEHLEIFIGAAVSGGETGTDSPFGTEPNRFGAERCDFVRFETLRCDSR